MNIGHLRSKEEEKLSVNVLWATRLQEQRCCFTGKGPEGQLYISWGIENWSTDLHNRIFSLPYGRHGSYGRMRAFGDCIRVKEYLQSGLSLKVTKQNPQQSKARWEIFAHRTDKSSDRTGIAFSLGPLMMLRGLSYSPLLALTVHQHRSSRLTSKTQVQFQWKGEYFILEPEAQAPTLDLIVPT